MGLYCLLLSGIRMVLATTSFNSFACYYKTFLRISRDVYGDRVKSNENMVPLPTYLMKMKSYKSG